MRLNKQISIIIFILLTVPMFDSCSQAQVTNSLVPIFSVRLLCPTNNANRAQFAQLMEAEFPKIGIHAQLDFISWSHFFGNISQIVGPYDKGGYDILFAGGALNEDSLGVHLNAVKAVVKIITAHQYCAFQRSAAKKTNAL